MKLERGNRTFCRFLIRLPGLLLLTGVLGFAFIRSLPRIEASPYDIVITLTSDSLTLTDSTPNIVLLITEPTGEVAAYWHDSTSIGGSLTSTEEHQRYQLADAMDGFYYIEVEMETLDSDARCQVVVTLYEGTARETVIIYGPFRMFMEEIEVGSFKMPDGIKVEWGNIVADEITISLTSDSLSVTDSVPNILLSVTEPTGEIASYWNDSTSIGGWVTSGEESQRYHLADAMDGFYYIEVEMETLDSGAYCQVLVTLYQGTDDETVIAYGPFRMYMKKLEVGSFKMPDGIKVEWGNIAVDESGCFIVTAAYGTEMAIGVRILSKFRDDFLLKNTPGRLLVRGYYKASPQIAHSIRNRPLLRKVMRWHLKPIVSVANLFVLDDTD